MLMRVLRHMADEMKEDYEQLCDEKIASIVPRPLDFPNEEASTPLRIFGPS
jgi:hypothetical protein